MILNKNPLSEQLVKLIYEFIKSVAKTSSLVQKFKIYNEIINNPIYSNRWQKAINEKL